MPKKDWESVNIKTEDAIIIDKIASDFGLKKYAVVSMAMSCLLDEIKAVQ
jgi:hypothetical protein